MEKIGQDKINIFQALIKRQPDFLDRPLKELLPLRFMGEVAVNAYRGLIKRLDNLPLSLEEKESRLRDGQDAGKALLMIEARIGELLPSAQQAMRGKGRGVGGGPGHAKILPEGIKWHQAECSRAIATHPHEVEEVIKEAEENEDIPTKTAVLNKIAYKKEKARKKGTRELTRLEMSAGVHLYYTRLMDALALIPVKPPREIKEIQEKHFMQIKAVALLIIKRLEIFNEKKSENLPRTDRSLPERKQ